MQITDSCARATVFSRKGSYDMFDFLASRHRKPPKGEDSDDDSSDEEGGEEVRTHSFLALSTHTHTHTPEKIVGRTAC